MRINRSFRVIWYAAVASFAMSLPAGLSGCEKDQGRNRFSRERHTFGFWIRNDSSESQTFYWDNGNDAVSHVSVPAGGLGEARYAKDGAEVWIGSNFSKSAKHTGNLAEGGKIVFR